MPGGVTEQEGRAGHGDRGRAHVAGTRRSAGWRKKMEAVFPRVQWGGKFIKSTLLAKCTSAGWDVLKATVMEG